MRTSQPEDVVVAGVENEPLATEEAPRAGATAEGYFPVLDGLRFFAFFAVFLLHFAPSEPSKRLTAFAGEAVARAVVPFFRAGALGVDLFFVLSAFLITALLLREHQRFGTVDAKAFLFRRALRIWPLYFVQILATCIVAVFVGKWAQVGPWLLPFLLLTGNWACAVLGMPWAPIAPLWSVSIEEQFYVLYPFVFRRVGPRGLLGFAAGTIALGFATRLGIAALALPSPWMWCSTFAHLDSIGVGVALAVVRPRLMPSITLPLIGAGLAAMAAINFGISVDAPANLAQALLFYPVAAVSCGAITLGCLESRGLLQRLLASAPLVFAGRISYGLYVFHLTAMTLVDRVVDPGLVGRFTLSLGLTFALTALSYRYLEQPFLLLKRRFTRVQSRPD